MDDQSQWSVRRPHVGVADDVANQLRRRLLSGKVSDGDILPKQEDLADLYGVSKVAIREALRILETEGLLEVRRGNVGGAIVHIPQPEGASYSIGLILQARHVSVAQVHEALNYLEPMCAGLCADRPDRKKEVLPALRASQRSLRRAIGLDNADDTVTAVRAFHESIVRTCGNEPLIVVAGALESIMTSHASAAGASARAAGNFQDPPLREATAECHEEILEYIRLGEADLAIKSTRMHLESAGLHSVPLRSDFAVDAAVIREQQSLTSRPRRRNRGES